MNAQDWIAALIALAAFAWLVRHFRTMVAPAPSTSTEQGGAQSPCSSCSMCSKSCG